MQVLMERAGKSVIVGMEIPDFMLCESAQRLRIGPNWGN